MTQLTLPELVYKGDIVVVTRVERGFTTLSSSQVATLTNKQLPNN